MKTKAQMEKTMKAKLILRTTYLVPVEFFMISPIAG